MNQALLDHLRSRRTVPAAQLGSPGPESGAIDDILTIAARVPDHGKLVPWRFVVYGHGNRAALVEGLEAIAGRSADDVERQKRRIKVAVFAQVPVIVGVLSNPLESDKIPQWEQQLSAAAVCLNAVHAAHGHGYNAQWLTEWFAYDGDAARFLGAQPGERFAGFIFIGTPKIPPVERDRPDLTDIRSVWTPE